MLDKTEKMVANDFIINCEKPRLTEFDQNADYT